jgi:hypothetical protein
MGSVPKKKSPSPSNRYPQKSNSPSINEIDPNLRVSPSPPANKIPTQSLIGFNSPQQGINYPINGQNNSASKSN